MRNLQHPPRHTLPPGRHMRLPEMLGHTAGGAAQAAAGLDAWEGGEMMDYIPPIMIDYMRGRIRDLEDELAALRAEQAPRPPTPIVHPGEAVSAAAVQMTAALDTLEAALVAGEIGISPWNRTDLEMLRPRLWRAERMWPDAQAGGSEG